METNRRVGTVTREMFAAWFPWVLRPLARRLIHATLDDALIEAFGFPRPSKPMRRLVASGLRLRGRFSWLAGCACAAGSRVGCRARNSHASAQKCLTAPILRATSLKVSAPHRGSRAKKRIRQRGNERY
jgi:hypothetical protein